MTLKEKTTSGLIWSFIDNGAGLGISFITGVILARLLIPKEFGLIGMITIFIAISQSFINSGFSQALIRKQNCTETDYSTVFYFNTIVGISFYFLLFGLAEPISHFYHEPILRDLIRVLGLGLIISSLTIIQTTILTKRIDFKLQAKISVTASFVSGIISIYMAYSGWGVWSLVAQTLLKTTINSLLLWFWNKWMPIWVFSKQSFSELFSFGSKLLISGLIDTTYRNIYYLVIGKYFSAVELGYYTRADQFQAFPSSNLNSVISRVTFPVLVSIQDDNVKLKAAYRKLLRSTMLITFVLMLGLAAIAKPMILTLIGTKWLPSVVFLQMLCFVGMLYPLHALNLTMLNLKGRSDLFLQLEIIKKAIAIPTIIIGVLFGIKIMIVGMFVSSVFAYYLNSYYSGKLIGYSMLYQVKDILPAFLIAAMMASAIYAESVWIPLPSMMILIIQLITGAGLVIGICEAARFSDYFYIKALISDLIIKKQIRKHGQIE
jgi:O-antigen/teichoic acid export membrane protein